MLLEYFGRHGIANMQAQMNRIKIVQCFTQFDSSVRDILILISTPAMPALAKSHAHLSNSGICGSWRLPWGVMSISAAIQPPSLASHMSPSLLPQSADKVSWYPKLSPSPPLAAFTLGIHPRSICCLHQRPACDLQFWSLPGRSTSRGKRLHGSVD